MSELERTTRRTVEFAHAFIVSKYDGEMPPGLYEVETEEELIPGLSFIAYRRVRTTITSPAVERGIAQQRQVLTIEPAALEAALARDRARSLPEAPLESSLPSKDLQKSDCTKRVRQPETIRLGQSTPQFAKHNLISNAPVIVLVLIAVSFVFINWYRPALRAVPGTTPITTKTAPF